MEIQPRSPLNPILRDGTWYLKTGIFLYPGQLIFTTLNEEVHLV